MTTHVGAVIPFENAPLPAHLQQFSNIISGDDLISGATGGYPVISIKGKVFHIVRGDERQLITRPDSHEPAGSIEVVILRANPALSKIYYEKAYEEGSEDKPTCYSTDGIAPAADAAVPQAQKCAACPHNVWGSKITEEGNKGKACADSRRLAVAPVGQLNDVMLLRVPAASLKPLAQYGDLLKKRGVAYPTVSTLISFDWSVAYPALTFKPVGFLSAPMMQAVQEVLQSDLPAQVAGLVAAPAPAAQALPAPQRAAPAPQPAAQPVTGFATAPAAAPQPVVQQAAPAPKPARRTAAPKPAAAPKPTTVSFGGTTAAPAAQPAPAPAQPAPAPARATPAPVQVVDDELTQELSAVLRAAGFDDAAAA